MGIFTHLILRNLGRNPERSNLLEVVKGSTHVPHFKFDHFKIYQSLFIILKDNLYKNLNLLQISVNSGGNFSRFGKVSISYHSHSNSFYTDFSPLRVTFNDFFLNI